MTEEQIRAAWLRWMHRSDVEADLDTIWALSTAKVRNRLLATYDEADVLEYGPSCLFNAGLIYLHELMQDDEGAQREIVLFDAAMAGYAMGRSLRAGPAEATRPFDPAEETV